MNNILFFCLDSARYDTFTMANAPNMKGIGTVREVHSFSCWTIPSIVGYLFGWPPIGIGKDRKTPEEKWRFNLFPGHERFEWAPRWFAEKGYVTAFFSGNPCIQNLDIQLGGAISKWFKYFKFFDSANEVVPLINEVLDENPDSLFFICTLFMETHRPYDCGGEKKEIDLENPKKNLDNQRKAIEYTDRYFGDIVKIMKRANQTTTVIITSDHGDLVGPIYWSHDPSTSFLKFDEKLFQIPFIEGEIIADG